MKYSAGMMSVPFLFLETRKTAQKHCEGLQPDAIKRLVLDENIYQMKSLYRAERYVNVILRRLDSLPVELIRPIAYGDLAEAKLLTLLSIMQNDRLFFEFMYEAFRPQLLMGSTYFEDKEPNLFFANMALQSDIVSSWADTTVVHLKQCYIRILFEAGLLDSIKPPRRIRKGYLPEPIRNMLFDANLHAYLFCLTGEQ